EDPRPEGARGQLDGQLPGRVLAVEDRVDLDEIERPDETRLGDELAGEVRLAVGEPSADGSANARSDLRIDRVEVERHVHEPVTGDSLERRSYRVLDPEPVELRHREDEHVELVEELPLAGVELARADE